MATTTTATSDEALFNLSLLSLLLIGPPTYLILLFIQAPYGRHVRPGWGPTLPPSLAWLFMESPSVIFTPLVYLRGRHAASSHSLTLISVFLLHYLHRTIIYPLRLRNTATTNSGFPATKPGFPVSMAVIGLGFNLLNAYVQGRWVSHYGDYDHDKWFWWRFSGGLAVFLSGMVVNVKSDMVLVGLKAQGGGYKIPRGGLFELVSMPNYFGEIMEWLGWTIMTWSWAGFGFLLYTCSNLVPRARGNHKWYLEKFGEDYPRQRKAVIPFLY